MKFPRRGGCITRDESWKPVNLKRRSLLEDPRVRRLEGTLAKSGLENPLWQHHPRRRHRLYPSMIWTILQGTPVTRIGELCLHLKRSDCWIRSKPGGLIPSRDQCSLHYLKPGNGEPFLAFPCPALFIQCVCFVRISTFLSFPEPVCLSFYLFIFRRYTDRYRCHNCFTPFANPLTGFPPQTSSRGSCFFPSTRSLLESADR